MLNINQLQYFIISAEQKSLSKAAEVLYTGIYSNATYRYYFICRKK